jgi:predicted phosphoribosyltransferase
MDAPGEIRDVGDHDTLMAKDGPYREFVQLSTAEVEDVFAKPDGLIKQSQDKIIVYKKIGTRADNSLAVVAVEQDGNIEVITVMVNFEVKK